MPDHFWDAVTGGAAIIQALAGLLSAAVAVALWRVSLHQRQLMREQKDVAARQNTIMDGQTTLMGGQLKATEDAAKAATQSANASEKSAHIADIGLKAVERGYLEIGDFALCHPLRANDRTQTVKFAVTNTGRTPVKVIGLTFDWTCGTELPNTRTYDRNIDNTTFVLTAGKSGYVERALTAMIDAGQLEALLRGNQRILVWGRITFIDVFKREHRIRYAAERYGDQLWDRPKGARVNEEEQEEHETEENR